MRFALATVGTTGDVRPFAALARSLADAGHEVTSVSWPVHRAALTVAGTRFVAAGPHADPAAIATTAEAAAAEPRPIRQVEILRDFHLVDGPAHYRTLVGALDGHDLVLIHGIHSLAHAAVLDLGVRWTSAVFDPVLLPTSEAPPAGMPSLGPLNRLGWWLLERVLARTGGPLDAALGAAGSRERGLPLFRARSRRLHLVACSPHIARVPGDLPATTHFTGAWIARGAPNPLPLDVATFLDAGEPPVVLTFGSMRGADADRVNDAVARIGAEGRRVVIQDGGVAAEGRGEVLSIGPVDHRALFRRAAVVVHHGGAGTTHAACAAGVPSVVVPHVGDQRYWADRLHRLGVAPAPIPVARLTGKRLAASVQDALAHGPMRERAVTLGRHLQAEDGVGRAVELLEGAVAGG